MLSSSASWASGGRNGSQPLGAPCGGLGGVEAGAAQCGGPVVAQVNRHRPQVGGRGGAQIGQRLGFELDDRGLIDLVDGRAVRPGQSVPAGVQARGEDHRLTDAAVGRLDEEVVEEAGAHGHHVAHPLHSELAAVVDVGRVQFATGQPGEEVHSHGAHQRLGEGIVDQRVVCPVRQCASDCDAGRSRAHAGGQVPGVVVSACHCAPSDN